VVSSPHSVERRAGSTRDEWQKRFADARGDVKQAQKDLDAAREALGEKLGETGAWRMTAPGLGGVSPDGSPATTDPNVPADYKLSLAVRRAREELDRSQRALQDLRVEANLAGVPEDWRRPEGSPPAED
jgi:hypothetical protein